MQSQTHLLNFRFYKRRIVGMNPIQKAIFMIGGPSKAARVMKVSPQAVCFWRDGLRQVPAERCPEIERATNGLVTCEELRPDLTAQWQYLRNTKKA